MRKKFLTLVLLFSLLGILGGLFFDSSSAKLFTKILGWQKFQIPSALAAGNVTVQSTIKITVCGNNIKETGEQCDGVDLGGQSCQSLGYTGGTLSCKPSCEFNTSACTSGGGGGGGGGGGYIPPTPQTTVNFSGRAYPKSTVTLLKDAQIAASTAAGADSNFQISLSGISAGNYIFSVYSEDKNGNRSSLLTFPVGVTSGVTTNVSGIFIAPTIAVDKSEVKRGDNIAIFGQSVPNSEITISVSSDEEFFNKVNADASGVYLYNFDTSPLAMEQHFTKSKAAHNGEISSFSKTISFLVGTKNVVAKPTEVVSKGDMNNDKQVNLVDFSITAYWYKRPSPPASVDLNSDGKVDLVDFSIMAYFWTG